MDDIPARTIISVGSATATVLSRISGKSGLLIKGQRKKGLPGKWHGTFHQPVGPYNEPINGVIRLDLRLGIRKVLGSGSFSAEVKPGREEFTDIDVTGGFRGDRFLLLTYENTQVDKNHFGTFLLEYSSNGDKLTGEFLGWGVHEDKPVHGTLSLARRN